MGFAELLLEDPADKSLPVLKGLLRYVVQAAMVAWQRVTY